MTPRWTVVTVAYNSVQHLRRHWAANGDSRPFDWIVVDNGSADGSSDFAESRGARVIRNGRNDGFSAANNIGLDVADTEYTVFVNPDVTVPVDDWGVLLAETVDATGGFVAPQLLNTDGSEQFNARGFPFLSAKIRNRTAPSSEIGQNYARGGFVKPTYCVWLMGAAVGGRTKEFKRIGGWDSSYILYYEDHDLGLRAWKCGVPVVLDPRVRWVHDWQRKTTGPDFRAWRLELNSMRTFYSAYPEFLRGTQNSHRALAMLKESGFGIASQKLWKPVSIGDDDE
jgi:N-acetylglucosaminyl-diphospho-decaprenol L-rhamnosyltransferase